MSLSKSIDRLRHASLLAALGLVAIAAPAGAVTVLPGDVLPNAVSYEYFGLNFAENIATSTSVGTLDYTGQPGCGGVCTATTVLGSDPSVSFTNNEVTFEYTAGGGVTAKLGYFVEYFNSPGTYNINLHATQSIDLNDSAAASDYLEFGPAYDTTSRFNNFSALELQEANCLNTCYNLPIYEPSPGPFVADHTVQMVANTLYYVELGTELSPGATGVQDSVSIDPTFTAPSGSFVFSPGAFSPAAAVPEFASWAMMIVGLGAVGATMRYRRRAGRYVGTTPALM